MKLPMNGTDNPNRPTSTATLWVIGGVGGIIVAWSHSSQVATT